MMDLRVSEAGEKQSGSEADQLIISGNQRFSKG
jgi:hypothetical protein